MEECATTFDGQVVLGPIPQFSQVLVVQCIKGVNTRREEERRGTEKESENDGERGKKGEEKR